MASSKGILAIRRPEADGPLELVTGNWNLTAHTVHAISHCCRDAGPAPARRTSRVSSNGLFGGWSEASYLEPGVVAALLPDEVAPEDYLGGACGLVTAVHAIDHAASRHIPFRDIGARIYALGDVNLALADAEAMRLRKALVSPRASG